MNDRLIGRAGFLGIVGAGVAGLFYGRQAQDFFGRVVPKQVSAIVPSGGWRIYTIGNGMPNLQPASYRLAVGGLVGRPQTFSLGDLRGLPRARQVSTSTASPAGRSRNVHWTGSGSSTCSTCVQPAANGARDPVRLGRARATTTR